MTSSKAEAQAHLQTFHGLKLVFSTIAVSLATFMFVLDYTICNVAIPYIAGGLASGVDQGTYVLTFFSVGNAVFLPLTGWLSKRYGEVQTLLWAVILFTVFSALCGASTSLTMLVVFRFCQGAAAGPLVPLSQGAIARIFPPEKLNVMMIVFSMIILIAPVLGPIVGGYFCIFYDWRWIFYINVPVGIFCAFVIWVNMRQLDHSLEESKVDYISFFLLLIGMTVFQLFLDKGEQWNWFGDHKIQVCFTLFVVSITYLLCRSFLLEKPLLKLDLFGKNKAFTLSCILIFTMYSIYMGTVVLVPLWLQTYQEYNALWSGIAVSPIGLGSVVTAPIMGRLIDKIGRMIPIIIGLIIMILASLYSRNYYPEYSLHQIMLSRFVLGLGIGCWIVPVISMPAFALRQENMSEGLGVFHFIRVISGAIGISAFTTIFKRRIIHQHFNLASVFNEYNPQSREYFGRITELGAHGEHATAIANRMTDVQAASVAINEVSMLMLWLCVIMLIFSIYAIPWERQVMKRKKEEGTHGKKPHVRLE